MDCSTPGCPIDHQLLELAQTHVHRVSDDIQPSHPLSSPSSPAFNFSQHQWVSFPMSQFFAPGGQSIGASATALVIPMNIQSWFPVGLTDLTLKSLLQCHSMKASILQHSAFFIVQLSHLYTTAGETIALTIQMFVGKVMFLLFSTLSRLIIASAPRSKCLLISWLQILSTVILKPKKIKSVTFPTFPPFIAMKWWDWMSWS